MDRSMFTKLTNFNDLTKLEDDIRCILNNLLDFTNYTIDFTVEDSTPIIVIYLPRISFDIKCKLLDTIWRDLRKMGYSKLLKRVDIIIVEFDKKEGGV